MNLPNFLVIGAARCGTSSFCAGLDAHPDVFFSDPKEPFFFCHDDNYEKGLEWYASFFDRAGDAAAVGEGSTTYSKLVQFPHAAERVARDLPDAKLIYLVRHPLEQIASHYVVLRSHRIRVRETGATVSESFAESVRHVPVLIDTALYWKQISAYREHFPDERILILFFEDYKRDPADVLRRAFGFLGVDPEVSLPGAGRAQHGSHELVEDRALLRPLQDSSIGAVLRRASPRRFKDVLRPLIKRRIGSRPEWDPQARAFAVDRLEEDTRCFLEYAGRPGFWSM